MKTYYHGTTQKVKNQILKEGLQPNKGGGGCDFAKKKGWSRVRQDITNSVYFTTDKSTAERYSTFSAEIRNDKPIILALTLPSNFNIIIDEETDDGLRFEGVISPKYIEVYKTL